MSNPIDPMFLYMRERLKFFPWMIMPLYLFIIGHSSAEYQMIALYPTLWGVFFFRTFDDYFCSHFDKSKGIKFDYLSRNKNYLLTLCLIFALLYLSSTILIFDKFIVSLNFGFILSSIVIYLALKGNRFINILNPVKYLLLLFMVASYSNENSFIWIALASTFFITRSVLKEVYQIENKRNEYVFLTVLLICKLGLRFF